MGQPRGRVACVQAAPVFMDREASIEKACQLIAEAGREGAQVAGFSESFIPGYPFWVRVGTPRDDQRYFPRLFDQAVEVPSAATERLCQAARDAGIFVVMGITERVAGTLGTPFNTLLFISSSGQILGKHRKIMPTTAEKLVWGMGDGSGLRTFPTPIGTLGGLICGENVNSLARFSLLAQREAIHVASYPALGGGGNPTIHEAMAACCRAHAFEGKVFTLLSATIITEEILSYLSALPAAREILPPPGGGGYSAIIGPDGDFLAGPIREGERILYADIDLNRSVVGRLMHDTTGHYNRFDILSLRLNRAQLRPLTLEGPEPPEVAEAPPRAEVEQMPAWPVEGRESRDESWRGRRRGKTRPGDPGDRFCQAETGPRGRT